MIRAALIAAALMLFPAVDADAHEVKAGSLTLSDLELRASLGRNPNTGGYLTIRNAGGRADRLVSASCACAERVEIHEMKSEGGVMRMRALPQGLTVPANGTATLAPGGAHLMLFGLKAPLQAGQDVELALTFERAGRVTTVFHVTATPGRPAPAANHDHHDGHAH